MGDPPEISQIKTTGDFSPGWVGGDYKVSQTIVQQYSTAKSKSWRGLEESAFAMPSNSETSKMRLWGAVFQGASLVFRNAGYTKFTFIVYLSEHTVDDVKLPIYSIITHKAAFCVKAHELYRSMIEGMYAWQDSGATAEHKKELEQKYREKLVGLEDWSRSGQIDISNEWNVVECTCDPIRKECHLVSVRQKSLDPAEYADKVRRSSEVLRYVVAALSLNIGYMGDLGWYADNYSLMKLSIDILDRKGIDFSKFRINLDDDEEWDYENGAFDEEVRHFKGT